MHPNPAFRGRPASANLEFAQRRGFGQLSVNGSFGPLAAHVPFVLSEDGSEALLHLTRSNPIVQLLDQPLPALLSVTGPDAYVSPDWYGVPDQAPTWNYVAVHLRGALEPLPQDQIESVLDALSENFEARLAPKTPWRASKMDPSVRDRLMRAIMPLRLVVEEVDGTWKLAQNKPDEARLGVADELSNLMGSETAALSALMRHLPEDPPENMDSEDLAS
jgi:transcriptional regulator